MSSRPVSLNLVSSFENDLDLLGAGSKSVVLPEQLLKSSLLCPEWPPLKKMVVIIRGQESLKDMPPETFSRKIFGKGTKNSVCRNY